MESLGAASWDALLAVAEMDESEASEKEAGEKKASDGIDSERRDASFARRVSFGTEGASSDARSSAVRAMRAKRDEVESEEPQFGGLREVRVEDEAVGTRL